MTTSKIYIGTKQVKAVPMTREEYNTHRGWAIPVDENPEDKGYHIEYKSGYETWCPDEEFNSVYRSADGGITFGDAIYFLKQGKRVTRQGWNGKGMYLFIIAGNKGVTEAVNDCIDPHRYEVDTDGYEKGRTLPVRDAIYMKTADDQLVPWVASQSDVLAEDWHVV